MLCQYNVYIMLRFDVTHGVIFMFIQKFHGLHRLQGCLSLTNTKSVLPALEPLGKVLLFCLTTIAQIIKFLFGNNPVHLRSQF